MEKDDILTRVSEKLDAIIRQNAPQIQARKSRLKETHPDPEILMLQLISEEAELAASIDAICLKWVETREFPRLQRSEADRAAVFVWDRFFHACTLARWLRAGGCQIFNKSEPQVLAWLLCDCWSCYGRMAWRARPAISL